MKTTALIAAVISAASLGYAYGSKGHETVGAIADYRIQGTPAAGQVTALLQGISLAQAAKIPDQIKSWDEPEGARNKWFHLPAAQAEIEKQLWEFTRANPHLTSEPADHNATATPDHHWFHFVDLPAYDAQSYSQGGVGTSKWDLVQMTSYCVDVLRGNIPAENDRHITKPVALILLTHYVGDLHQPLHVGAEYFSEDGQPMKPDAAHPGFADRGGNLLGINFEGVTGGSPEYPKSFHGFWDTETVDEAMRVAKADILQSHPEHPSPVRTSECVEYLATTTPAGWDVGMDQDLARWDVTWVNETQLLAFDAHARVDIKGVTATSGNTDINAGGTATERDAQDSYQAWSGKIVKTELGRAGWRLAAVLEKIYPAPMAE